jgi:predicted transcriptional regulator
MIAVELPDAEEIPASALKVKAKQKKMRTAKELKNFTILMENPEKTFIQEIAAKSHRSAALLMAKKLKGTLEEPVRVRIKHTGEDEEKIFDTWIAEKEGKKGTVFLPRAKEIKEILEEPPEIKEADLEG